MVGGNGAPLVSCERPAPTTLLLYYLRNFTSTHSTFLARVTAAHTALGLLQYHSSTVVRVVVGQWRSLYGSFSLPRNTFCFSALRAVCTPRRARENFVHHIRLR